MSAPLDLGTLVVKLAADVGGLAKANVEMKKSVDSMKSMARAATGVWDGAAGAVEGLGRSVKKITRGVSDIFGKDSTAQGQRWGREIQSALGMTGDQVKALEQSMKGLDGALEIVGQSMGLIKSGAVWLAAGGAAAVLAFAAAFGGVLLAIGAVSRYSGDLRLLWEDLKRAWGDIWKDTGGLDSFLDSVVNKWADAVQSIISILRAGEEMKIKVFGGSAHDIAPGMGPDNRTTGIKALDFAQGAVDATRRSFGSSAARADTGAQAVSGVKAVAESVKGAIVPIWDEMVADLKEGANAAGLGSFLDILKGFGTPGKALPRFDFGAKLAEDASDVLGKKFVSLTEIQEKTIAKMAEASRKLAARLRDERINEIGQGSFLATNKYDDSGKLIQGGTLGTSGIADSVAGSINTLTSAITRGAPTVAAALSGFAQGIKSGNIWGAIIGAISGLLTQSRGFALIMGVLESSFKSLSDVLGNIFLMLGPFIQIGDVITQVIGQVLVPVFKYFATILSIFYPIIQGVTIVVAKAAQGLGWLFNTLLEFVGGVLGKMSPIVNAFGSAIAWVAVAFADVTNWLTGAVGTVLSGIGGIVQTFAGASARIINSITSVIGGMISGVAGFLGGVNILGVKPFEGLANTMRGWAASINANKLDQNDNFLSRALEDFASKANAMKISPDVIAAIRNKIIGGIGWEAGNLPAKISDFVAGFEVDTGKLSDASKLAIDSTWDKVMADIKAKDAAMARAEADEKATQWAEALSNVPTGYRVASARYEASIPSFATGGYAAGPTLAMVGDSPGGEYMVPAGQMRGVITINISGAGSPDAVAREVMRLLEAEGYASRGARGTLAPVYTGA